MIPAHGFLHNLISKRRVHFVFCLLNGVCRRHPGEVLCARAKGIAARTAESMPIRHREAEMFFHRFAIDHPIFVVPFKCQRIFGRFAFVLDFGNAFEIGLAA